MKKIFALVNVCLLIALAITMQAGAESFVLTGTDHLDIETNYSTGILADYSTAHVMTGGYVTDAYLFNYSVLTISDGGIGHAYAYDSSVVDIYGGSFAANNAVRTYDNGTVNIYDGSFSGSHAVRAESSDVNIFGGSFTGLKAVSIYETSKLAINGGSFQRTVISAEISTVNIYDGSFTDSTITTYCGSARIFGGNFIGSPVDTYMGGLHIFGGSFTNQVGALMGSMSISAGDFGGYVWVGDSRLNISGGSFTADNTVRAYSGSEINISGGSFTSPDSINAWDSRIHISGGDINSLNSYDSSIITFYGYEFIASDGLFLHGGRVFGTGTLSGKWFDGTPWTTQILSNDGNIQVVPEPSSMIALAGGLGALLAFRRRRQ